jgi:hypothetical protein
VRVRRRPGNSVRVRGGSAGRVRGVDGPVEGLGGGAARGGREGERGSSARPVGLGFHFFLFYFILIS